MSEKKQKKELSTIQVRNRLRFLQYSTFYGQFLAIISPYVAMGIVNAQEWFPDAESGWKVGLGGTLAFAMLGISIFLVAKKQEKITLTKGYIAIILGWYAAAFIFMLLANLMSEIAMIMLFGGLGLMGGLGLVVTSDKAKERADEYSDIIKEIRGEDIKEKRKAEIRRKAEEELKKEEAKTIKVKVKKIKKEDE